jgi:hypothetical protein
MVNPTGSLVSTRSLAKDRPSLVSRRYDQEGRAPEVNRESESRIGALKGKGRPLPESSRVFFEQRLGHDFSKVRIHADTGAANTARALNAKAFTLGHDIVFARNQYAPETTSGRLLLAHELTHVVQQMPATAPATSEMPLPFLPVKHDASYVQREEDQPAETPLSSLLDPPPVLVEYDAKKVYKMVQDANKILYDLLENGRVEEIGGIKYVFDMHLRLDETYQGSGEFKPPKPIWVEQRPGVYYRSSVVIIVNPRRMKKEKKLPTSKEELEFRIAQTILHELAHAQIWMENLLEKLHPREVGHTEIFENYRAMMEVAESPALEKHRKPVENACEKLMDLAGVWVGNETEREDFRGRKLEYLIQEKCVNQFVAEAFGGPLTNSEVAGKYAGYVAEDIKKLHEVEVNEYSWSVFSEQLEKAVKSLYDAIDKEILLRAVVSPPAEIVPEAPVPLTFRRGILGVLGGP